MAIECSALSGICILTPACRRLKKHWEKGGGGGKKVRADDGEEGCEMLSSRPDRAHGIHDYLHTTWT